MFRQIYFLHCQLSELIFCALKCIRHVFEFRITAVSRQPVHKVDDPCDHHGRLASEARAISVAVIRQLEAMLSQPSFRGLTKVGLPERAKEVQQAESTESRLVVALIDVEPPC